MAIVASGLVTETSIQTKDIRAGAQLAAREPLPDVVPHVNRYQLRGEVGRGGMGRVLKARDQELLREVAIKVVRPGPDAAARLTTEARVTGQLDHPNVLPVYDLSRDDEGSPFFTMKLVEDHLSLADLIVLLRDGDAEAHAQFSFQRRVRLIQEVCHALHYAHECGVIHRDIKPENILVGRFGEVYLVDWGLAMGSSKSAVELGEDDLRATEIAEDCLVGTPLYMAPELFGGSDPSPRTDVYSLSAVLYELLSLRNPLGEPESLDAVVRLARGHPPAFADTYLDPVAGRVPRALAKVCARGLEKDPDLRYGSARALEQGLQSWLEGRGEVFCAGTSIQRGLSAWSRWIDQHTYAGPIVTLVGVGLMVGLLVREVLRLL